jgi:hypothetical protein
LSNIVKSVEKHTVSGTAARQIRSPGLQRAVRTAWEEQRRFPLQVATVLSQQFAGHGLQFFKVNRTLTHVSVARPHFLDLEATPVSEGVRRVVEFINSHPRGTRRKLLEILAPTPVPTATPNAPADGAPPIPVEATPEQTALASDLHWLIHEGHVIEFANGTLETAKKPLIKPPKPAKAAAPVAAAKSPAPTAGESSEIAAPAPVETAAETASEPVAVPSQEFPVQPSSAPPQETTG